MENLCKVVIITLRCCCLQPINDGIGNWPWCGTEEGGLGDRRYRYNLASLTSPRRCIGFARRRYGRGGRSVEIHFQFPFPTITIGRFTYLFLHAMVSIHIVSCCTFSHFIMIFKHQYWNVYALFYYHYGGTKGLSLNSMTICVILLLFFCKSDM